MMENAQSLLDGKVCAHPMKDKVNSEDDNVNDDGDDLDNINSNNSEPYVDSDFLSECSVDADAKSHLINF